MAGTSSDGSHPQSLTALKALLGAIQAGEADIRLGPRAFRTLAGMVDAPRQAAVYSISQLAEVLGVNPSTLTRLSKRLGYTGFAEFQAVFRQHVAREGCFYSDRAGYPGDSPAPPDPDLDRGPVQRIAEEETVNLSALARSLDIPALEAVAGELARVNRVRIRGVGQFHAVACFMSYALGMLRSDVGVLGDPEQSVDHGLAQMEADDVLVTIGCAPFPGAVIAACRIAHARGIHGVVITGSADSPLAPHARHVLTVPMRESFFGNSVASALVLIEGLLSVVARRLGDQAVKALRHREALIRELSIGL